MPLGNTNGALPHSRQDIKPLLALIALVPITILAIFVIRYRTKRRREQATLKRVEAFPEPMSRNRNTIDEKPNSDHPKKLEAYGNQAVIIQTLDVNSNNAGE